jgi:hypothetical protein
MQNAIASQLAHRVIGCFTGEQTGTSQTALRERTNRTLMAPTDGEYSAWRFAIRLVADLLLATNTPKQAVYANIASPEEWSGNGITVWAGDAVGERLTPKLRIGDMSVLWVWDG